MNIEHITERFLIDEILFGSRTNIDPDESLVTSGILDSLALLRLVTHLETQLSITFDSGEVIPEHFETINSIKLLVDGKLR